MEDPVGYDFLEEAAQKQAEGGQKASDEVMEMVHALDEVNDQIAALESQLKLLESSQRKLSEQTIPMFMDEHGITEITLSNGRKVTVSEDLFLTLPADPLKRRAALAWIRDIGGGDKIRKDITVSPENEEQGSFVVELLSRNAIPCVQIETVHAMSLKSLVKEWLGMKNSVIAQGTIDDVPEGLSPFIKRKTTIR